MSLFWARSFLRELTGAASNVEMSHPPKPDTLRLEARKPQALSPVPISAFDSFEKAKGIERYVLALGLRVLHFMDMSDSSSYSPCSLHT